MKRWIAFLLTLVVFLYSFTLPAFAAGEYRSWLQSDPRWGSISFGSAGDTMSKSGCAITSIAKLMVHSGAVPDDENLFNPGIYVNWLKQNGAITSQGWIVWGAAAGYSNKFSYVTEAALSGDKAAITATIKSYVDQGYVIVVCTKNGGHYVPVERVADGTVYIMDSAQNGPKELFGYWGLEKIRVYKGPHNGSGNTSSDTPSYDTTVDPVGVGDYVITSDNGVNLRSGAGTSFGKVGAIPHNTTVRVTEVKNGWGRTTYDGVTGWFTLEFAHLAQNSLRGLTITPPTKLTYIQGEDLNTDGLTVTALYTDGTQKTITSGYTVSKFTSQTVGTCDVYVSYQTKAAKFTVTITPKEYELGLYQITSDDGVLLRSGSSTSHEKVGSIPYNGLATVTKVENGWGYTTYNGVSGWFCLQYARLTENTLQSITVTPPKKLSYMQGESLDTTGMTVTAVYADGSKKTVTEGYTLSGFSSEKVGECKVTVSYQNKTAAFTATITQKVYQPGMYEIIAQPYVNLRAGADTSYDIQTMIPYGERVTVNEVKNNWGKTIFAGMDGWFCLDYAIPVTIPQTGLAVEPQRTVVGVGQTITADDLTVYRVFEDGNRYLLTEFSIAQKIVGDKLVVTVTDGTFSTTVELSIQASTLIGDCDQDGKISASDALSILKHIVGKSTDGFDKQVADVNGDGQIAANDALYVLQIVVGKQPQP